MPVTALVGGILIGLSAALILIAHGKIAGISGILGGALAGRELEWRLPFLVGLIGGGAVFAVLRPAAFASTAVTSPGMLIAAGLLVGFGTRLGNGCTSGHGVCGVGRMAPRSIAATALFVAAGMATVFVARHVLA